MLKAKPKTSHKSNLTPLRFFTTALFCLSISMIALLPITGSFAQDNTPTPVAGTLVPPTLVPVPPTAESTLTTVSTSGIATVQQDGVLRVGTRFNTPPFVWLDESGELVGYEIDIIRNIAEDFGAELEFVQVTAETEQRMLLSGEVDLLIGQQIHTRQAEEFFDFSYTYYYNYQRMVIREGDIATYTALSDLADHRIGIPAGSRSEEALGIFMAQNGIGFDVARYLSEDSALDALANFEVDAIVGELDDLSRAGRVGMSLVGDPVREDPYAIAVRRYDVNFRNAINRSLQKLLAAGTIVEIGQRWFPTELINYAAFIPLYDDLDQDTRTIDDFPIDMPRPAQSVLQRIRNGEELMIAGLDLTESGLYYQEYLDPFHEALVREMARRWGVPVRFIPDTVTQGVDLVADRQADLAIGVRARWDGADRVDYSVPYHYTSGRILVLDGSRFGSFSEYRTGQWIATFQDAPQDTEYLEGLGRTFSVLRLPTSDVVIDNFGSRDIDGLYADLVRILAFTERYSNFDWRILGDALGENSFQPLVFALPRNDADFLTLVNWTLGDMFKDGTLERIWRDNYDVDTWASYNIVVPNWIPVYPGIGDFLNESDTD